MLSNHQNYLAVTLFFFIFSAPFTSALYFHISETERKCFIEEIPDETVVIGKIETKFNVFVANTIENLTLLKHFIVFLVS